MKTLIYDECAKLKEIGYPQNYTAFGINDSQEVVERDPEGRCSRDYIACPLTCELIEWLDDSLDATFRVKDVWHAHQQDGITTSGETLIEALYAFALEVKK